MARLTSDFWVMAYLARLSGAGIFAHVAHKGDPTAGAVMVKLATMDGHASIFTRTMDVDGNRAWSTMAASVPEQDADATIARQRGYDRDLWVIEVEDPKGRHLLEEDGLA